MVLTQEAAEECERHRCFHLALGRDCDTWIHRGEGKVLISEVARISQQDWVCDVISICFVSAQARRCSRLRRLCRGLLSRGDAGIMASSVVKFVPDKKDYDVNSQQAEHQDEDQAASHFDGSSTA